MFCFKSEFDLSLTNLIRNVDCEYFFVCFLFFQMKEHLDYFLNETQFSAQDITHFPYIFNRNIDEIKLRVVEMKRIGAPITLPMLYQGKTKYLKYIQKYCATPDDFRIIENRLRN